MTIQQRISAETPAANMIIRGRIISDNRIEVTGRGGDLTFSTPDPHKYVDQLPLGNPSKLSDLYELTLEEIYDYLEELGTQLNIERNAHMQRARELSYFTAPTTPPIVNASFESIGRMFARDVVREMVEASIGSAYLEGWVQRKMLNGSTIGVRCFGSRCLHIVAGNHPMVSAGTIIRNAVLRSDAIIKAPSNDPFTALAIAQTMCDFAPDHPLTKHLTVAYWRGGDVAFEEKLYQPHNLEKIIAWGGFASVKHVTRYIQPGLELISLDPKRSASIVGPEAFKDETSMREVAVRLASDVGGMNQNGCINARVIYVMSGTDEGGLDELEKLARYVYEAMLRLPNSLSTKPKKFDRELKSHVEAVRLDGDWYRVIGGDDDEGAVIMSRLSEPVEFAAKLIDRVCNMVPVDSIDDVIGAVNSYTQTVGVYPETLREKLRNILPLHGAQRVVSLGYAVPGNFSTPQDGIETLRRMGKWITDEVLSPETVLPPWQWPVAKEPVP